jgi:hypothetical protein
MAAQPPWAIAVTPKTKHDLHPYLVTGESTGIASGSGPLTDRTIDRHVTEVAPDLCEEALTDRTGTLVGAAPADPEIQVCARRVAPRTPLNCGSNAPRHSAQKEACGSDRVDRAVRLQLDGV